MKNSTKVKNWRKSIKIKIIESFGSVCGICGYNRCIAALELHHLNPKEKDIGISKMYVNCSTWNNIVSELRKCVLLCCLCHREVHSGIISIPENIVKYNDIHTFSIRKQKQDWNTVNLLELKKTKSNNEIAKILNISSSSVRNKLRRLSNIENF